MKTTTKFQRVSECRRLVWIPVLVLLILLPSNGSGQTVASIAVSNVDTRGIELSPTDMGNLLRLQLEKTGMFNIIDRYDMTDLLNIVELDITNCYGKSCWFCRICEKIAILCPKL